MKASRDLGFGDSITNPKVVEDPHVGLEASNKFDNGAQITGDGSYAVGSTMMVTVNLIYDDPNGNGNPASTTPVQAQLNPGAQTWNVTLPPAPRNDQRYIFCVRFQKMTGPLILDRFIDVGRPDGSP